MPSENPPLLRTPAMHALHPDEEPLELGEIQAGILLGFKSKCQTIVCLRFDDDAVEPFRAWLRAQVSTITSCAQLLDEQKRPATNIALSHGGLARLTRGREGQDLAQQDFVDAAFREGMTARSVQLGDPADERDSGHATRWLAGGQNHRFDCLVILADDDPDRIAGRANALIDGLPAGVSKVHRDDAQQLDHEKEHFGFRDGISQPGIRGFIDDAGTPLCPRLNPNDQNHGKPGQPLIWPGEFVFGYRGERRPGVPARDGHTVDPISAGPTWARNGSLLVFRRLEQRVFAFREFVRQAAAPDPDLFAAKLVGRWQSGAPLLRAPANDNAALGESTCANNNFAFRSSTPALPPSNDIGVCSDDDGRGGSYPVAVADPIGDLCPFAAHIRKAYARDDRPEVEVRSRRLLRRGIPYGKPLDAHAVSDDGESRGLLFLAYQTSFERQFEAITQQLNDPDFARKGIGHDPIVGHAPDGRRRFVVDNQTIETTDTWVVATGGEYLFAPSLSALRLLAADN